MKSIIFLFLLYIAIPEISFAQSSNDQRVLSTRIADILAKFPAENKDQLNKNLEQLVSIKQDGLQEMLAMFTPPGQGDNTALEYAVAALSSYVIQPGKDAERKMTVQAYCHALNNAKHDVTRDFIIRQLQLIGKDDAVSCLAPFLQDAQLAGPAARALAQINNPLAAKTLLDALASSSKDSRLSITEALGYMRNAESVPHIHEALKNADPQLKKISWYALARIADPSSVTLLKAAAKEAKYTYEDNGATAAYILYISQTAANGKQQQAAKLAGDLMSESAAGKQVQTRSAALNLLVRLNGNKSLPLLYRAMQDGDIEYRAAALAHAKTFQNSATNKQWLKTIAGVSAPAKVQIINYLGNTGDKSLLPDLKSLMQNADKEVRKAAIEASARIGQTAVMPSLVQVLKKGSADDIAAVKQALLVLKTNDIAPLLLNELGNLPPQAAAAVLDVLALRRAEASDDQVFKLLSSSDTTIHNAAARALPSIADKDDLTRIFSLLNTAKADDVMHIQNAIINASASITDTVKRTAVITDEMSRTSKDKQYLFLPMLASIGGKDALNAMEKVYNGGDARDRKATIDALSKSSDLLSAAMLLKIARNAGDAASKVSAVNGYIDIIDRSKFTADQKVLMLREAMALAVNNEQKKNILGQAAYNKTFSSLVFAGDYLDDPSLRNDAAMSVMRIGLDRPEFTGKIVRELLSKAAPLLKGQDREYQKEAIRKHLNDMPQGDGFVSMFNGKDLNGWKGLVDDPVKRSKMTPAALAAAQKKADEKVKEGWEVKDGLLVFTGHGDNLASVKQYGDFEMLVDWKITSQGDAGIYLRGTPQVQIWDTSRRDVGAEVGSGGLYNNQKNASKPLVVADNQIGEWNTFRILMKGDKVTVFLNGKLVVDNTVLENYWDRNNPIFPKEQIELQAHGTYVAYRNLYIREINSSAPYVLSEQEKKDNFKILFDGGDLNQWVGNKKDYVIENNELVVQPGDGSGGNLFTKDEYSDFIFRFEFQLTPGANNGLGIRAPLEGDAAYEGMELQILDNEADIYKNLKPYQYHGSVYGTLAAKRGFLKPTGEWNYQEVIVKGTKIKVILNNEVILDGDIQKARDNGAADKLNHPGLKRDKGHIGFLGHGSVLRFKNIRIKPL